MGGERDWLGVVAGESRGEVTSRVVVVDVAFSLSQTPPFGSWLFQPDGASSVGGTFAAPMQDLASAAGLPAQMRLAEMQAGVGLRGAGERPEQDKVLGRRRDKGWEKGQEQEQ